MTEPGTCWLMVLTAVADAGIAEASSGNAARPRIAFLVLFNWASPFALNCIYYL